MNGYIQVEINGKKVGVKFNMYAAENFTNVIGIQTSSANIVRMIWAGILGNSFVKQKDPEVSFEDVADWVEILTLKGDDEHVIDKITETFLVSEPIKVLLDKASEKTEESSSDGSKKKTLRQKKLTGHISTA